MLIDSPFTLLKQSKDQLLHTGFDYRGQILRRTMSRDMFRSNAVLVGFLERLDAMTYELIECVKRIKTFASLAMDKNERRII